MKKKIKLFLLLWTLFKFPGSQKWTCFFCYFLLYLNSMHLEFFRAYNLRCNGNSYLY